MYFRLMAAMFGLPVTPMSEGIQQCPIMLLYLKNIGTHPKLVISRSNYDIILTSGVIAAILNVCERGLKLCDT
jgi:hypothetical protein